MIQLLLHLWGDYILQSDWMANEKTKRFLPAAIHATLYSLPFFLLVAWPGVVLIGISHFLIDRYRLVKYILRLKEWNFKDEWGYKTEGPDAKPAWMWVWLMIVADNTLHLTCNYLILMPLMLRSNNL